MVERNIALGPMWLHPGTSATISRLYFECHSTNTGEIARFTGVAGFSIEGGSLDQCSAQTHYVLWNASKSNVMLRFQIPHCFGGESEYIHPYIDGSILPSR